MHDHHAAFCEASRLHVRRIDCTQEFLVINTPLKVTLPTDSIVDQHATVPRPPKGQEPKPVRLRVVVKILDKS
jgi:hypothetical protein